MPPARQIAFSAAESDTLPAAGEAFLGFSAHVQRDLPFVRYDSYLEGYPVGDEDRTLVDQFSARVDAAAELEERFDPTDPREGRLARIEPWRETARRDSERLRDATDIERAASTAEIEQAASSALLYQGLVHPAGVDPSERDAHCQQRRRGPRPAGAPGDPSGSGRSVAARRARLTRRGVAPPVGPIRCRARAARGRCSARRAEPAAPR